jgi:hypothetical protein
MENPGTDKRAQGGRKRSAARRFASIDIPLVHRLGNSYYFGYVTLG